MRPIVFLFLASTLYIGSVFLATQGKTFRLDSDYDSNFPIISYVVDTIRTQKRFPLWNPYVATGISVLGDPLSGVTYLPYLLPMLALGVPDGWWVVLWLHAFLAGVFMWMFLRGLRVNPSLALWGGLLYLGAGAFAARVAAGHIEKVLSYPWYPLFLLLILRKKQTINTAVLIGAAMGLVFLAGDMYAVFFMAVFYGVVKVVSPTSLKLRGVKETGGALIAFILVSSVKLIPFLIEVAPTMQRFSEFDPSRGSIHAWFSWIPFILPFGVVFYDRPSMQQFFGLWYNWYEYYAFIGLPVLFLWWLSKIVKRREAQLLLLLLAVGIGYISRRYGYSPWHGLEPLIASFRTPQRMFEALTSVMVALIVLSIAHSSFRAKRGLLTVMLLLTFIVSGYQMTKSFEPPRRKEERYAKELRQKDEVNITTEACCMQLFLVREKIRIINYYYGWFPKTVWINQK